MKSCYIVKLHKNIVLDLGCKITKEILCYNHTTAKSRDVLERKFVFEFERRVPEIIFD